MNLSTPRFLVIPAFLLLAACGAGDATHEASLIDVAQAAARQDDRVSVEELAAWIVEDRRDFALVDVRAVADYDKGRIGDARNIPIAALVTAEQRASLPAGRKILVYSNGSENGAKAATLLRMAGVDAYVVTGGYNAWQARILNPDIPAEELDGESLEVSAQRALSCYFVGDRGAGADERPEAKFVPPVFTEEEDADEEPLPPPGAESC